MLSEMGAVEKTDYISVEEYYRIERVAEERSDYFDGEMFNRAGGTTAHSIIKTNLVISGGGQLKGKKCSLFDSDQRIKSAESSLRMYPDASVFYEPMEYDEEDSQRDTAVNPTALFEVLSDSTEAYDRGLKFHQFLEVESMKAYVLVSQKSVGVEVFERSDRGSWEYRAARGRGSSIEISSIGVTLMMDDVYDRLDEETVPDYAPVIDLS